MELFVFRWRAKSEPHHTWHGDMDRGVRTILAPQKCFDFQGIVSPLGDAENLYLKNAHQG